VRVLLDEQLPRQLGPYLIGHEVRSVQQEGWAGLKNGELISRMESSGFSVLVTGDQSLEFQQNVGKRRLGVVVLRAPSNASRLHCTVVLALSARPIFWFQLTVVA
jgi:hypothetical protein